MGSAQVRVAQADAGGRPLKDRPRILMVSTMSPWPPNHGGRQRTWNLIRALQRVGQVDLLLNDLPEKYTPGQKRHLRDEYGMVDCVVGRWGLRRPWSTLHRISPKAAFTLADWLEDKSRNYAPDPPVVARLKSLIAAKPYDLLVSRYLLAGCRSGAMEYGPLLMDVDDVDTEYFRSRMESPGTGPVQRMLMRRHLRNVRRIVDKQLPRCQRLWLVSDEDRALVRHDQVDILPNIPFAEQPIDPCPERPDSRVILAIGSLHPPNVHGVDYFVRAIWPAVHAAAPDATFEIGGGMPPEVSKRWATVPGVKPLGFVDQVRPVYDRCAFAVAPIYWGAGTKIKVVEALAHGRACLATSHSMRGYEATLKHGESIWHAADDAALIAGCVRLLKDPALRARLAVNGSQVVKKYYTLGAFSAVVERSVEQVLTQFPGGVQRR